MTTTASDFVPLSFFISFPLQSALPREEQSTPGHMEERDGRGCIQELRVCRSGVVGSDKAFPEGQSGHRVFAQYASLAALPSKAHCTDQHMYNFPQSNEASRGGTAQSV